MNNKCFIINEKQLYKIRKIINESISDIVYNFTGLEQAYYIIKDNKYFMQSSLKGTGADDYGGKLFYMSTTRNKNTSMSYANNYKRRSGVRFTLDGRKLNEKFKGMPIDYWDSMGKQMYMSNKPLTNSQKVFISSEDDRKKQSYSHKNFEYEDRVLSNNPVINNFLDYVLRIDVILYKDNKDERDDYKIVKAMLENLNIEMHVYDNQKDFNYQRNEINKDILNDNNIIPKIPRIIGIYGDVKRGIIAFFMLKYGYDYICQNYKKINNEYISFCNKNGFEKYISDNFISQISDLKIYNGGNYESISSDLSGMLNDMSNTPNDDNVRFCYIVQKYLKSNGISSFYEWGKICNEKYKEKFIDYKKKIKFFVFIDNNWGNIKNVSENPEKDSFWDFVELENPEDREGFVRDVEYFEGETYTMKSKSYESFKKYLQYISKKNISISEMFDFLNKLKIPYNSDDFLGNSTFEYRELSYDDIPYDARYNNSKIKELFYEN